MIEISEVQSINPEFLSFALDLMNRTQGKGLFDASYLTQKILNPNALVVVGHLTSSGEPVSIGCAEILSNLDYYLPFDSGIGDRMKNRCVGSLSSLSVVEPHQGKGFGQMMTHFRVQWLMSKSCETILGVSWVSGKQHTSDRVFEKTGFHKVSRVTEFYKNYAINHPFHCPGCKQQPCVCDAILYELDLKPVPSNRNS